MSTAERYKQLLRIYGIPQARAAQSLGISPGHLSAILNGYSFLSSDLQTRLQKMVQDAKASNPQIRELVR